MRGPRPGVPLSRRLVYVFVGLLAVGLSVGTLAMTFVLSMRLTLAVDDDLHAASERFISTFPRPGVTQTVHDSYRSGLVFVILRSDGTSQAFAAEGAPEDAPRPDLSRLDITRATPITVPTDGIRGPSWRIIVQPFPMDEDNNAYLVTALSLNNVDATLSAFVSQVVLVDIAIIAIGGILAFALVKQSLRPLREIERTAGAIAAGDLSQRVPEGPLETETGSLANSLNVMLTQIERSFDAQRASEERMRRFVSDASHELRTPLATVQGYGELYRIGGIPDDELPNAMGRIESEAQRMGGLVTHLLQLARLDEGHPMRHTSINLTMLAVDAIADLRALDSEREASVTSLDGGEARAVVATVDEDRIRQILTNLIGNAVQHTPEGTPVEIAVGESSNTAIIEVRDHGSGVPTNQLTKIFGRFHRVDSSRSRQSGGTGLGLAIVAAIVQAHRGSVRAMTTDGGGLTIRVTLPTGTNGLEGTAEAD